MSSVPPDDNEDPGMRAILNGIAIDPERPNTFAVVDLDRIHKQRVGDELGRLRARHEANATFSKELAERTKKELEQTSRIQNGADFLLDVDPLPPAIWGVDDKILWARGESLIIAGPQGVGKTTIAGQLIRGLIGLGQTEDNKIPEVLGFPVQGIDNRVGYLAMDRPQQARRALGRMFAEEDRGFIGEMLRFWSGPLPTDVAQDPDSLVRMAERLDSEVLILDSIKDAAIGLSKDEVGAGYNRARQKALAEGIQLMELHHVIKNGADGGKPNNLNGVYGSTWITAGAGSVIMLWGEAGDEVVELLHLKQPMSDVGPFKIQHDRETGLSHVYHDPDRDLVAVARRCPTTGLTVKEAAQALYGEEKPSDAKVAKTRRKLAELSGKGLLVHIPAGISGRGSADRWLPAAPSSWSEGGSHDQAA